MEGSLHPEDSSSAHAAPGAARDRRGLGALAGTWRLATGARA